MGYMTNGLSLNALRGANTARLPQFKNGKGEPAHSAPDGSDWALSAWCNAVLGELGEAANIIKKIERGDFTLEQARPDLAKEFADVLTYLDILAFRAGVDLGRATIDKFNEVSERVGSTVLLAADDWHYMMPMQEIELERRRQVSREGYGPEHDDAHYGGELLEAATCYYLSATTTELLLRPDGAPVNWPWEAASWKPKGKRRDLVRAGALTIAEADRLRRRDIAQGRVASTKHCEQWLAFIAAALVALDPSEV